MLPSLLIIGCIRSVFALNCNDLSTLLDAGTPLQIVLETVKASSPLPTNDDLTCLRAMGIDGAVIEEIARSAGIDEPESLKPDKKVVSSLDRGRKGAQAEQQDDEQVYGDWLYTKYEGSSWVATQSRSGTRGVVLSVTCNGGFIKAVAQNFALMLTKQSFTGEVSFNGHDYLPAHPDRGKSAGGLVIAPANLKRLMSGTVLYVRWYMEEGLYSDSFSLRGATPAIQRVASDCGTELK